MYLLTLFDLGSKIYYEEGAVVFSKDGFYFYPAHYDRSTQSKWPWQETGGRLLVCLDDSVELWLADKISCLFYLITIQLNRPNACLLTAKPFTVCRSNLVNWLFQSSIQWIIRITYLTFWCWKYQSTQYYDMEISWEGREQRIFTFSQFSFFYPHL